MNTESSASHTAKDYAPDHNLHLTNW